MLDSLLNFLTKTGVMAAAFQRRSVYAGGARLDVQHRLLADAGHASDCRVLVYLAIRRGFEPLLLLPLPSGCC